MGVYLAVLITSLLLGALPAHAAPRQARCISCHAVHYAAQGGCTTCHRGNAATSRRELAHSGLITGWHASFRNPASPAVVRGKQLAEQGSCRRCHQLHKSGNRLTSNLDNLLQGSSIEAIVRAIAEPASFMPNFYFSQQDRDALVTYILAAGLTASKQTVEPPQVVHFNLAQPGRQTTFAKQCGGCHKLLSERYGGQGSGAVGPNLSGLLTRFYPATFQYDEPWTVERLKRWLKNPRAVRSQTMMRPIALQPAEWDELLKTIETGHQP